MDDPETDEGETRDVFWRDRELDHLLNILFELFAKVVHLRLQQQDGSRQSAHLAGHMERPL